MCRHADFKGRPAVAAEIAPATKAPGTRPVRADGRRRDEFAGEQVVQGAGAHHRDARVHRVRQEILHDERAVVIGEEGDMVRRVQADKEVAA